jgi:hypothetical protein
MKNLTATFLFLCSLTCFAQDEFLQNNNKLIYSDATIGKLKLIVDSLNIKFKVCDLGRTYFSKPQAKGHYISLSGPRATDARRDIDANISFENFAAKYQGAKITKDLLVVRGLYKDYNGRDATLFSSPDLDDENRYEINFEENRERYLGGLKGKWVYRYDSYATGSVEAFYFTTEFLQKPIPEKYAKMILYSDCLVDTTAQIFPENATKTGWILPVKEQVKVTEFLEYVHQGTKKPICEAPHNEKTYEIFAKKLKAWNTLRLPRMDSLKKNDARFGLMLAEAVGDSTILGSTDEEFEEYVERYHSKEAALKLKRNRIVVGGCSMDSGPRRHAFEIARLSAETLNWEIFLRSHLDIMNDRFERVSDGSYAQQGRKTYIKELELLDINTLDLLLGISLRIENESQNHYDGDVGRIGRSVSETKNAKEAEQKMLAMISDKGLDDYNRVLAYYLFLNYNFSIVDKKTKAANNNRLKASLKTLPEYIATKIRIPRSDI